MALVAILKQGAWRTHGRVMKSADYARLREASGLLAAAREEAGELRERSAAAFEEEKKRGFEAGLKEAKAELARMQIAQAERSRTWVEGMERRLAELVAEAVERILGELDDTEVLARVVRRALDDFQGLPSLRLRVAPETAEPLRRALAEQLRRNAATPVRIEPDPSLGAGDCVLESPLGVVDLSLPHQLDVLRRALSGQEEEEEGAGPAAPPAPLAPPATPASGGEGS